MNRIHRIESYVRLTIIFAASFVVLYMPILFILKKRGIMVLRQLSYLGFAFSLFLILFATIFYVWPLGISESRALNIIPFYWINTGYSWRMIVSDFIPNILMFAPFGIFLPLAFKKMRKCLLVTLAAFCLSVTVETAQYFIGRTADINDVIANTIGGILGFLLFLAANKFITKKWWEVMVGGEVRNE